MTCLSQEAMTQCRRALRPDGLFLSVMWGGDTLHELRVALSLAEQEVAGGLSQRVSPLAQVRGWYSGVGTHELGCHDMRTLAGCHPPEQQTRV